MKAWIYDSTKGGAANHLRLEPVLPLPKTLVTVPKGYTLVKVLAAALNPVDLKIGSIPYIGRLLQRLPATPGLDFAGRVIHTTNPALHEGQLVAGRTGDLPQHGTMAELVLAPNTGCVAVPKGVLIHHAATIGTCGGTALQALAPYVKSGDRVFIHGGSGGTGVYQIQVAKALGCHVTTSCSGANEELCRSLGADEVLDYRQVNIPQTLVSRVRDGDMRAFNLVVDNVGMSWELYKAADHFLSPGGRFIQIGGEVSWADARNILWISLLPSFLGGGKRKWTFMANRVAADELEQLLAWMAEGKLRVPIDHVYPFEDVREAYRKLQTRRAKGKLVVEVSEDREGP